MLLSLLLLKPTFVPCWPRSRQAEVEESLAGSLAALELERDAHETTKEEKQEVTEDEAFTHVLAGSERTQHGWR